MSTRSPRTRHSRRRRPALALAGLASVAALAAGCGEEDFENNPRPARLIDVTAVINTEEVDVSPGEFGAGLVHFTISNQTDSPLTMTISPDRLLADAPTQAEEETPEIPAQGVGSIELAMEEGEYDVTAGDDKGLKPDRLVVGPPRASSQNDLLLP